jgi:anti-sigma-K factor RskA
MKSSKKSGINEELDCVGRHITRASVLADDEAGDIAAAPFLFTRVRARIADREQSESGRIWSGFRTASLKAIPAMIIVAVVSCGLSLYTSGNKSTNPAFSVDAYLGTNEAGIENMVFAEKRTLTTEEVLATILNRDEREAGK